MNQDEHDDLWDLLGKARPARPSPFFARNVLRAIRESAPEREPGFLEWLRRGWNALAVAGAAAVVLFMAFRAGPPPADLPMLATHDPVIEQVLDSPDFAVIANLDTLLTVDDNEIWLASIQP